MLTNSSRFSSKKAVNLVKATGRDFMKFKANSCGRCRSTVQERRIAELVVSSVLLIDSIFSLILGFLTTDPVQNPFSLSLVSALPSTTRGSASVDHQPCLYTTLPISQSAPRITENTLHDPGIQKAPDMAIRRNKATLAKHRRCFIPCPTAPGAVWGGHMSISAADLHRVQDLYRLDDNPGMGPYLLEVRYVDLGIFFIVVRNRLLDPVTIDPVGTYGDSQENSDEDPLSDSSAGDMEDEFPDFFVMPETAIATYGKALFAADCTAKKYEIPLYFADAMIRGGPPNSHWWVFVHSTDDAGPLKIWLRVNQGAHTPNPTHLLAARGWKRIVRNNNLRQGDFILFQIRSLNLRVLLLELPQPLF
ncbi:hypothetical protein PIB30_064985 [Stylosanthes scabra]|uniref:TF-B3 domain-containing protein n=1 Tax=Stylosanthes scabra TaxID=79078 RepID=A0ABU6QMH8_9FABA|nr:hypothetical protein [Stylosanthes scabra]